MKKIWKRISALFLAAVLCAGLAATGFASNNDDEHEHVWGEPVFNWSEDLESCRAEFTCEDCGKTETVDCDVSTEVREPSCDQDGEITHLAACEFDDESYEDTVTEDIPAAGHVYGDPEFVWSADDQTCQAVFICENCGSELTLDCDVTATETPATCTEDGYVTCIASVELNGRTYVSEPRITAGATATGHTYGEPSFVWDGYNSCTAVFTCEKGDSTVELTCELVSYVSTEPTCASAGERTYIASVSFNNETYSSTKTETIAPTGSHTWDSGTVTRQPTCTEDGERVYTCRVCGQTYTESIPALGHSFISTVTAQTCTETGYTEYVCSRCGYSYRDNYTDALGHSYETTIIQPTCTEQGYTTHTCTRCGYSYTDSYTAALGHDYQSKFNWSSDYTSCTITVTCSRCDYRLTDSCAVTHSVTKQPGCETLGETSYTASYNGLSETVTVADIPATDHTYQADTYIWTDEDGRTWEYGVDQNDDFVWNDNVTCKAHLSCTVCGKTFVVDCVISIENGYTDSGIPTTTYKATVGDTDMFFTVTRESSRVVSVSISDVSVSGEEAGDTSAEEANEKMGEVVSVSSEGTLSMPTELTDTPDTGVGVLTVIGICLLPVGAGWITYDVISRKRKKKDGGGRS